MKKFTIVLILGIAAIAGLLAVAWKVASESSPVQETISTGAVLNVASALPLVVVAVVGGLIFLTIYYMRH